MNVSLVLLPLRVKVSDNVDVKKVKDPSLIDPNKLNHRQHRQSDHFDKIEALSCEHIREKKKRIEERKRRKTDEKEKSIKNLEVHKEGESDRDRRFNLIFFP